ncbi:hypothetical protein PI124_g14148 [Phytophthora idaei]|nr:hypothetical protein PI125_g21606 [Phytophthora idaei]KAG3132889.1 hypothetical protein PI126_g19428 [Phytophthora idaei]KAG3240956.1 hypothetical protein PI124_g14148 [Phytophthora idaei]
MRCFIAERKEEVLVKGEYDTFCAHRQAAREVVYYSSFGVAHGASLPRGFVYGWKR